jgi:NAD+ kinase
MRALEAKGIEAKLVNRFDYTQQMIDWAQLIVTSGGDGTFLMAASKINDRNKPIVGVNSDPKRSVGYLCLPTKYSNNFDEALQLLSDGHFKWKFRQRIRVILEGEHAFDEPIELHNQQLRHPEYRFLELETQKIENSKEDPKPDQKGRKKHILPFRALNEVFVGESLSSRVSYYEFSMDGKQKTKIKSSGLTICTGTGSTSWSFNINKVTPQCVHNLFQIINEEIDGQNLPLNDSKLIQKVTDRFNSSLIFDVSEPTMAYTIRDPVVFGTDFHQNPRGFAKTIEVKSRMTEANIVIDGGLSYKFNDGANATFDILEEDALRTISLKE